MATGSDWCEFERFHKTWVGRWSNPDLYKSRTRRRNSAGPEYGGRSGEHPIVRCPRCGKRLALKAVYCIGGEFTGWKLPQHKPRVTRKPGPKRKSRASGRGK